MRSFVAVLALLLVCVGCQGRHAAPLRTSPLVLDTVEERQGELAFMAHCNQCHPGTNAGVGPSPTRLPQPDWSVRLQVRWGLGAMPAFSKTELPDEDLEAIIAYLRAVRTHD